MVDTKISYEPVLERKGGKKDAEPMICAAKLEDLTPLFEKLDLYLKPIAKINLTVQLPKTKLPGQCISTWEVMEKLKKKAKPHSFKSLIVTKNTIEFIRFEGEFESKLIMDMAISRLNRTALKLSGFVEPLKVKCAAMKLGSTRHEWESYFRDNPKMNEHKAGYRPDTIHLINLPVKWFGGSRPDTKILTDVFKSFGDIKRFHVPLLDELELCDRSGGFKKFTHSESLTFEAFIMFKEYIGFVKAMDTMRGMKLVKQLRECNKLLEYDITVDFDKTKHLSDKSIKKRKLEKEYGIKNSEEMKKLKEETKKQRSLYEERINSLRKRKLQAKSLLKFILDKVADKETLSLEESEKERKKIEDEKRKQKVLEFEEKRKKKLGIVLDPKDNDQSKDNDLKDGQSMATKDFSGSKSGDKKGGQLVSVISSVVKVKNNDFANNTSSSSFDPVTRGPGDGHGHHHRYQDHHNYRNNPYDGHRGTYDHRRYHPYHDSRRDDDDDYHDHRARNYDYEIDRRSPPSRLRDDRFFGSEDKNIFRPIGKSKSRSSSPRPPPLTIASSITRAKPVASTSRSFETSKELPSTSTGSKVPPWMTGAILVPLKICVVNDKVRKIDTKVVEPSTSSVAKDEHPKVSKTEQLKRSSSVEKRTPPLSAEALPAVPKKVIKKSPVKAGSKVGPGTKLDVKAALAKRAAKVAANKKPILTGIKVTGLELVKEIPKSSSATVAGSLSSRFSSSAKCPDVNNSSNGTSTTEKVVPKEPQTVVSSPTKQTIHINPKMIRRPSAIVDTSTPGDKTSTTMTTKDQPSSPPVRRRLKRPAPALVSTPTVPIDVKKSIKEPEAVPSKKKTIVLSTESGEKVVKPTLLITTTNDRFKKAPRVPITAPKDVEEPKVGTSDDLRRQLVSKQERSGSFTNLGHYHQHKEGCKKLRRPPSSQANSVIIEFDPDSMSEFEDDDVVEGIKDGSEEEELIYD